MAGKPGTCVTKRGFQPRNPGQQGGEGNPGEGEPGGGEEVRVVGVNGRFVDGIG